MAETLKYDEVLYPSTTQTVCHIRRHRSIAGVFGLAAAPLSQARVLEVGCGDGWSLFPQAEQYPEAQFLGFDYARRPIEHGQQVVAELGLPNVELRHADIMQIDASWGQFDYIVAHGFYCWVPAVVQQQLLSLLGQLLAPRGVVYLSYNVLPGWRTRQTVRDFMRYRTRGVTDPPRQIKAARRAFQFLSDGCTSPDFQALLAPELEMVKDRPDGYLYHDHLAEINEAFYFHELLDRLRPAGLQYLGDTDLASMYPAEFPAEIRRELLGLPTEEAEQTMDFLRNREFRTSLFCRAEVTLDRQVNPPRLLPLDAALAADAECSSEEVSDDLPLLLICNGREMHIPEPLMQAVVLELAEAYPAGVACRELLPRVKARLNQANRAPTADDGQLMQAVLGFIWHIATIGVVELSSDPVPLISQVAAHPTAARTARYQARQMSAHATNQKHRSIWLEPLTRRVLLLCDGGHSQQQIIAEVAPEIEAGQIAGTSRELSQMQVLAGLRQLAGEGLLVG